MPSSALATALLWASSAQGRPVQQLGRKRHRRASSEAWGCRRHRDYFHRCPHCQLFVSISTGAPSVCVDITSNRALFCRPVAPPSLSQLDLCAGKAHLLNLNRKTNEFLFAIYLRLRLNSGETPFSYCGIRRNWVVWWAIMGEGSTDALYWQINVYIRGTTCCTETPLSSYLLGEWRCSFCCARVLFGLSTPPLRELRSSSPVCKQPIQVRIDLFACVLDHTESFSHTFACLSAQRRDYERVRGGRCGHGNRVRTRLWNGRIPSQHNRNRLIGLHS